MSLLNRLRRGVIKTASSNPNLTETPYIAGGVEGSVQYKGANNALSGDSNLLWNAVSRLLTVVGVVSASQVHTTKQTFAITGANPVQAINLDNGSYILLTLQGSSGTLTLSFTNAKVGASYVIQVVQSTTKVDINIANEGRLDGLGGAVITGVNSQNYIITLFFTGTSFIINTGNLT